MKIAVLLSGGVDSSVALKLLKEQGHDLTAFYLKIWLEDELSFLGECPWEDDLKYAEEICEKEDIPLKIIPLQKEYRENIITYTINEVKKGRTPNPDILCNQKIKFGAFFEKIDNSFEKIATGHYAKIKEEKGKYFLCTNPDPIKDQTYFLAYLSQEQLSRIVLPLGDYTKEEIRGLAQNYNLPNKHRKDSQGLCFLGKISFSDFIKAHIGTKKGDFVDYDSKEKIGEHDGSWFYTIGQRRGIKLDSGPYFVVDKDSSKNIVYISKGKDTLSRYKQDFNVQDMNWLTETYPIGEYEFDIKIRHGAIRTKSKVKVINNKEAIIHLEDKVDGIANGQFAVFYKNDICIGSGIINY